MPNYTKKNNKTKQKSTVPCQTRSTRASSASRLIEQHNVDSNTLTTTRKRRASESSPTKLPEAKKTTHSNMSTITLDDLQKLLQQQTATIKNDIQQEIKVMSDDLKASFHSEITKLNERVDAIESNALSQLTCLKNDIDNCVNRLNGTDDDFVRITKLNELKISGIAHSTNENLHEIFCSIAKVIGYDVLNPSNLPDISRMHKRTQQNNDFIPLPSIIVKFVAPHIRNKFYGLYLARATKEPILTEHLNLSQGGTVRIGEMLTPHNQNIFTEAIKLKRDKKLQKVNTVDGQVRVKFGQTDRFVTIKSKRELETYISSKMGSSSLSSTNATTTNLPTSAGNTATTNNASSSSSTTITTTIAESASSVSSVAAPVQQQPPAQHTNNQHTENMQH